MRIPLLCPVLLAISCGTGGQPPAVQDGSREPVYVQAGPAAAFQVSEAGSDTLFAIWSGRGPLRLVSSRVEPGDSVSSGDTIATGIDSLASLELEQVGMSLEFAEAAGSHPSSGVDSARIARLEDRMDSLEAARSVAIVSPADGRTGTGLPQAGAILMPGARVAPVIVSPESLFVLSAPPGAEVFRWPESAGGAALVEGGAGSAVYSGARVEGAFVFPGTVSLPRQALRDSGLGAFVVLENGDSIGVERICISGDAVTVLPDSPIQGMRIIGWAAAGEGI